MSWEYALIGAIVGIIIGAGAMYFGNHKLHQQQTLQCELEKSKVKLNLNKYHEELTRHFTYSTELLENMASDYRQLYQQLAKTYNSLLPDQHSEDNSFHCRLTEAEADNDQIPTEIQPRDYLESTSSSLHTTRGLHK